MQSFHAVIGNTASFTEKDQVSLSTEQFWAKTCQNQHELQTKYMNTCSFKLFPYDLEISGFLVNGELQEQGGA